MGGKILHQLAAHLDVFAARTLLVYLLNDVFRVVIKELSLFFRRNVGRVDGFLNDAIEIILKGAFLVLPDVDLGDFLSFQGFVQILSEVLS